MQLTCWGAATLFSRTGDCPCPLVFQSLLAIKSQELCCFLAVPLWQGDTCGFPKELFLCKCCLFVMVVCFISPFYHLASGMCKSIVCMLFLEVQQTQPGQHASESLLPHPQLELGCHPLPLNSHSNTVATSTAHSNSYLMVY